MSEWKIKDEGLVNRVAFLLYQLERARNNTLPNPDDLHDAEYVLATYARKIPPRKSPRIVLEETILLVLGQVEAHGVPSIAMKRFGLLIHLLSQPYSLGGLGIFDQQINGDELQKISENVVEDLAKNKLIVVDSGSLYLSNVGSEFVNDRLLPCVDSVYHKWLDELIDRIDFWLVAVLEHESQVKAFFDGTKAKQRESLAPFLPKRREESLYSILRPKVISLVREYRSRQTPPYEPSHIPPSIRREKPKSVARIDRDISDIARFSRNIGEGVTRLAFSKDETDAMLWAKERLIEFNFDCRFDAFMNLHAYDRRKGNKRILVGTHIDTVLDGGKYDGVVGLVAFLEVLRLAKEEGMVFSLPVDFVIFRAEESTVFKVALLGSKVATGKLGSKDLQNIRFDRDQELKENLAHYYPEYGKLNIKPITLLDVLSRLTDAFPSEIRKGCWFFSYPRKAYMGYVEIHIEQGLVLEKEGKNLGIVTSFRAPIREIVTIEGRTNHSGTTPMGTRYRQDALCVASECVLAIERIANEEAANGVDVVATVGEISVPGMGINKIPGTCMFTLDLRSNDSDARDNIHKKICRVIDEICKRRKVHFEIEQTENSEPVSLKDENSVELRKRFEKAVEKLGYTYTEIPSGAGHDAMTVADAGIPTCMLLIPCKGGISHSPYERAEAADITKSARVLFEALCHYPESISLHRDKTLEAFVKTKE